MSVKERRLFISHGWRYDDHYETVVKWLNEEPYFKWKNYSVPKHDACEETTIKGLKKCLTNQIRPVHGVIIIAGMYAAYSDWIDYEIDEAIRMEKVIIGIKPRGQERTPRKIQEAAEKYGRLVGWNRESLIKVIRELI